MVYANASNEAVQCQPARRRPRIETFRLRWLIGADEYAVWPIPCDPSIGRAAVHVSKLTNRHKTRGEYDLVLTPYGWVCDCIAGLSGKRCRHIRAASQMAVIFGRREADHGA
jgi:hypothetical protein